MKSSIQIKIFSGITAVLMLLINFGSVYAEETTDSTPIASADENQNANIVDEGNIDATVGTVGQVGPIGDPGNIGPVGRVTTTTTTKPVGAEATVEQNNNGQNNDGEGIVTGGNETSHNNNDGMIDGGDANISAGTLNLASSAIDGTANGGNTSLSGASGNVYLERLFEEGLVTTNQNTGANSVNQANNNLLNSLFFNENNSTTLTNNLPLNINTGNNEADYNTGNGTIDSGDINLSLNIVNLLGSILSGTVDFAVMNVYGNYNGDIVVPTMNDSANGQVLGQVYVIDNLNQNTGFGSANSAETSLINQVNSEIDNNTQIANNVAISANTGGNTANYNTGNSEIQAGNIIIKSGKAGILNIIFDGQTWYLVMINVLGEWNGALADGIENQADQTTPTTTNNIKTENKNTGAESVNEANSNIHNTADINIANNTGITNNYDLNLNTGENDASYNTGNASIISGSINILANFINFIESNIKANNIYIFLANIFGDWNGGIRYGDKKVVDVKTEGGENTSNNQSAKVEIIQSNENVITRQSYSVWGNVADQDIEVKLDSTLQDAGKESAQIKAAAFNKDYTNQNDGEVTSSGSLIRNIAKYGLIFSLILMAAAARYYRKYNRN